MSHEHYRKCKCDGCCSDLFTCGDPIRVLFILDTQQRQIPGTYISSTCDHLIWRRTEGSAGNLECSPCSQISIIRENTGTQ